MIKEINSYLDNMQNNIERLDCVGIEHFIKILIQVREEGRNVFFMGNDYSAAIASKFCCLLNNELNSQDNKRFKAICLSNNMSTISEFADSGNYDNVFVEQLNSLYNPGDVVVGISKDGNCTNIIKAIEYANKHAGLTVALTGYNDGVLQQITNHCINVKVNDTQSCNTVLMLLCNTVYSALKS